MPQPVVRHHAVVANDERIVTWDQARLQLLESVDEPEGLGL